MFYKNQTPAQQDKYKELLTMVGSLSRLYTDNDVPYLYYRTAENIFCLAFDADNLSRGDVSVDAKKGEIGIGLKTFLHSNGATFQKIAEFNAISNEFEGKSDEEIILLVASSRNERLRATKVLFGLKSIIYHCVTRVEGGNQFYEFNMDEIDEKSIALMKSGKNTLKFEDGINEYSFNKSKTTLYKRFKCIKSIQSIKVGILDNPFKDLGCLSKKSTQTSMTSTKKTVNPFVYLPLYAPSSKSMEPAEKSGLNQWNAGGRKRDADEAYIPVPAWIHRKFPGFFPKNNKTVFELILPNGEKLSASLCQQGRKGLMSNPNKKLGKWLLRDVFNLKKRTLLTRHILNMADIDSARIEKLAVGKYSIDFTSTGHYEKFKKTNLGKV